MKLAVEAETPRSILVPSPGRDFSVAPEEENERFSTLHEYQSAIMGGRSRFSSVSSLAADSTPVSIANSEDLGKLSDFNQLHLLSTVCDQLLPEERLKSEKSSFPTQLPTLPPISNILKLENDVLESYYNESPGSLPTRRASNIYKDPNL